MLVKFKKLHPDATLPTRAKSGDAGMDVTCIDDGTWDETYSQKTYKTGLAMEIPEGYVGLLFPRSSICKTAFTLSNAVGVIDSGYRGEISAVFNRIRSEIRSNNWYAKGDRVVQLIVLPIPAIETEWADDLSTSERGEGGFGSTGK